MDLGVYEQRWIAFKRVFHFLGIDIDGEMVAMQMSLSKSVQNSCSVPFYGLY